MGPLIQMKPEMLFSTLFIQSMLQQQIIELQQRVIELQKRIEDMTPKNPDDEEVFWHIASDGISSEEAATSEDVVLVKRFRNWNNTFAKKYIKPYVSPLVYSECMNQMTRGLARRIADLEAKPKTEKKSTGSKRILQLDVDSHRTAAENLIQQPLILP